MCAGVGEAFLRQRQLEIHEPVVTHRAGGCALRHRGALRGVVIALAQRGVLPRSPALVEPDIFIDRFECRDRVYWPPYEPDEDRHDARDGQRQPGRESISSIDASRYSLRESVAYSKQLRDRMAIVYGRRRVANISGTRWLLGLALVSATLAARGDAPPGTHRSAADQSVHVASLSSTMQLLEDPGRAASTSER